VEGPEAWYVRDYPGPIEHYAYDFTETDITEIEAALAAVDSAGKKNIHVRWLVTKPQVVWSTCLPCRTWCNIIVIITKTGQKLSPCICGFTELEMLAFAIMRDTIL
jgi:hypothetical protein